MFNLYYLIDQSVNADIGGAKNFVASFPDLQSAIAQAAADQVTHFSRPLSISATIARVLALATLAHFASFSATAQVLSVKRENCSAVIPALWIRSASFRAFFSRANMA